MSAVLLGTITRPVERIAECDAREPLRTTGCFFVHDGSNFMAEGREPRLSPLRPPPQALRKVVQSASLANFLWR